MAVFLVVLLLPAKLGWAGQSAASKPGAAAPEAPQPQLPARSGTPVAGPCSTKRAGTAVAAPAAGATAASQPANPAESPGLKQAPCPSHEPLIDWYARFLSGPKVKPMKPKEKAWLAVRNVADPFNAVTILGSSAIQVGSNAHSAYGPGMTGLGRSVGVSYAQDMTGEFFGTFLIPSIVHQDPHYHRMPDATLQRRVAHCLYQVAWTQGDNGRKMANYANLVGFAIDDEIGNLYVPGQKTRLTASAERYGASLATAPIENVITEFLPDVARHIHVRVVVIQRIINQVAKTDATNGKP